MIATSGCSCRATKPVTISRRSLLGEAGEGGDLLAIGAGGGGELARFVSALPGWRFTAVDPSAAMLERARERLDRDGAFNRLTSVQGTSHDAPAGPFDAATAFLALQFVADDGERLAQLRAIHARMRPGAPFMVINCATDDFKRDQRRYADHARLRGAEDAMILEAISMQRTHVHFLTPEREEALLAQAGFKQVEQFYQAFWIRGWSATA